MRASRPLCALHARIRSVVAMALIVTTSACGGGDDETVTVFAASSLTDVFEDMAAAFESGHPGVDVELDFDGSSRLATQIVEGAPADVFASADEETMATVADADLVAGAPAPLAENTLVIVTQPGNPEDVSGLEDLARPDLVVALADPAVPVGQYAAAALERADVSIDPATLEPNVRAVVSRVALGEADAGIAYVTDTLATGDDVEAVPIPAEENVAATYSIATIEGGGERASEFVDFALSDGGRTILESDGFAAP